MTDDIDVRAELLRTVEAVARRWYPRGIPRALFDSAVAEASTPVSSVSGPYFGPSSDELPEVETSEPVNSVERAVRARFLIPPDSTSEEQALLIRAVTQGLRWDPAEVSVVSDPAAISMQETTPIVVFGGADDLAAVLRAGEVSAVAQEESWYRCGNCDVIGTVSLAEALQSREAKRQLWMDLQRLLAIIQEDQ